MLLEDAAEPEPWPSASYELQGTQPPSVLDYLVFIFKAWWKQLFMRVKVPSSDMETLMQNCGLKERQIVCLYKQFRLLVADDARDNLTPRDLERHCSLLSSNPLKKYTYRMLFGNRENLNFTDFVCKLSLVLSNSIGSPQMHLIKSVYEMGYFNNVRGPRDVAQMQKLLALFNCFDIKETGHLDTQSLCPLLYDLLRCDSDVSVSSLVPHSMISRMVNTAIACVHAKYPKVCHDICHDGRRGSLDSVQSAGLAAMQQLHFEGHRMLLTKELFIRDQEILHLDQLMAMRL